MDWKVSYTLIFEKSGSQILFLEVPHLSELKLFKWDLNLNKGKF